MRNTHLLGSLPILASVAAAQNGILSFPVQATSVTGTLNKRQLASDARTRLDGTIYTIDVSIGTPGRVVSLEIDTGAEEMWVNPSCGKATYPALCTEAGRFEESSSLVDLAVDGSKLADDGYVAWRYAYDTVSIGSTRIGEQIFGIAYDSERYSVGQLGLGPSPAGWESWYPYVLDGLVASQAISSKAFSLDLGSAGGEEGALIFGGIDTSRYTGTLEKISVVPASEAPDGYTRYWVTGSRITVSRGTSPAVAVSNTPIIFHVNSASPISALPGAAFTALLSSFPEAAPAAQFPGRYTVPCTLADAPGSVDFSLGGAVISVPLSDFVWRQPEACYLGAYSSEIPVLGANFLRAAYVVFDWDNRELHFANSVRERGSRCPPNLVAIGSGPGAVPSAVGSCQGSSSSTVSSTVSSTSTSSSSSSASSTISTTSSVSSTLSTSTISSTSISSTSATSTFSSTASSSTATSSTLSTSTLGSSAAASSIDTSSAIVSSTESSSSTHTPSTTSHTSASTTADASSGETSVASSISSDDGRLGGRGTDYNSRTASLESSTSSSDSSTISSSATSSAYDGASTSSVDGDDYPSATVTSSATSVYYGDRTASTEVSSSSSSISSTISRGASSVYYGARSTAVTYDDLACEVETRTSTSSAASPTYDAVSSSSGAASSSETAENVYEDETGGYSSFTASPTYGIDSSSSTSGSSESTEEPYQEKTYDLNTSTASPTYGSESSSSVTSSFTEEPYQEKTYGVTTVNASPTYGAESSSTSTSSASESTEEPYHGKTYAVTSGTASPTYEDEPSSSLTSSSSQSDENPYQEKTYDLTSVTASPTYGVESSSSAATTSCQTTEEPYEENTDTSAVYVSSTHTPVYDDKATQSAIPTKDPYQSDDYRDIPTITTILTTASSASGYDAVTTSPADEITTITITATSTYTITACSKYDSDCTVGGITTEVVTRLTTVCPDKTATHTTPASYTDDDEPRLSTSTKTSSVVTNVPSKTCTESKSDKAYPAPTAPGSYEGMGHRGYGSGPQDDIYHEEEARGDDVPAGDFYHRGDVVHGGKAYDEKDASPEYDGSHGGKIYGHDDFSYEDGPKEGAYPPAPEPAYAHGPSGSVQTPSATPAYTSFVTRSAPSASSTGDEYEHVTAGASGRGVPWLLIVCVGILTTLLMQ